MKKLMIITLALLAMSCSSDDDNEGYSHGGLTPDEAHFYIHTKGFDNDLSEVGSVKKITKSNNPGTVPPSGIYVVNTANGMKSFRNTCAYDDPKEGRGFLSYDESKTIFECQCGSQYSISTGLPISGKAKEKYLRLLEYKVTPQEGDGVYLVTDK